VNPIARIRLKGITMGRVKAKMAIRNASTPIKLGVYLFTCRGKRKW
jgi:hypothetical protein